MSKKTAFWTLLQLSTFLLYELLIFGGYAFGIPWLGWTLFGALMLLHIVEMKTALRIGKKHKIKTPWTISNDHAIWLHMVAAA